MPMPVLGSLLLTVFVAMSATAWPENGSIKGVEVLQQFLGSWETQTKIRHEGPPRRKFRTKGRAICRQTFHGRYFEFRTQSIPPGQADFQLMTYDAERDMYRQWLFDSDGYHHQAEGRWNPTRAILRWEGTTEGTSFVIEDRWVSPARLEWTLVRTDAHGRPLQTIEGSLSRVKGEHVECPHTPGSEFPSPPESCRRGSITR